MKTGKMNIFEEGELYLRLKRSPMTESAIAEMAGVELSRVTTLLALADLDEVARWRLIRDLPSMYVAPGRVVRTGRLSATIGRSVGTPPAGSQPGERAPN